MSNVRCFIQPTPIVTSSSVQAKCESHLFKRLKWISKSQLSENHSPSTLGHHVKECVVSNSYLAFLLDDGRVYRQKFGQSSSEDLCSDEESAYNFLTPEHRNGRDFHSPATVSRLNAELQSARSSRSTPGHHRLRPIVRSRERRAMAERWGALSGTGEVPEELIDQAMNVLQGKSREVVRRELMRTNLDVNLAVNNLLSHEDDVPDDQDGEESLPVIPSGDDLLSFLASSGASHRIAAAMDDETSAIEGAMTTALRRYHEEEQLYNETSSAASSGHSSKKKRKKMSAMGNISNASSNGSTTFPQLCFHGDVEWLCYNTEDGEPVLFAHIASLYSELIAVTLSGQLCQWKWANARPYEEGKLRHPRTSDLGLAAEEIKLISADMIRATVLTESLKFAVFYDETVVGSTGLLEHCCTSIIDLNTQQSILSLQTSSLFSAILTNTGKIYWWGVLPFGEQKQQLEKWQEDRLNDRSFDRKDIKEGDKVMMRSRPLCSVGMKAVVLKHSCPVVGVLQESVFSLHEKYRFKLSHGSPTQSCESTPIRAGIKRSAPEPEGEGLGEVVCTMNDVIMIEDGQCATGTVLKVDGVYAAVSFSSNEGDKDVHSILGGCRLFRIDQLTSSSTSQLPSPFQLTPKKLKLPSTCKALAMSVDNNGITVILSTSNGIIRCANISLLGGVVSEKGYFPQIQVNYFTKQNKLKLHSMLRDVWLLEDENGGLFPITKDHIGGIKDFPFIPLSPIECVGISRISNKTSVVCVVTKEQPLINSILSNTKQFHSLLLTAYTQGPNSDMFKERCAGDYNFLHLLSCCFLPPPITITPHPHLTGRHTSREGIRDLMRRANYLAAMGFVGSVSSSHHQENDEDVHYHDNPTVTSEQLAFMLQEDCKENKTCQQVLLHLLQQRNIEGDTPFMTAVRCRNYPTAIKLLKICLLLTSNDPSHDQSSNLLSMLYPDGSHPDDNPLFVLCHNEPCSYTWTGRDHIMQDVYECYNCGLTGSLCCCTECAFTCHRGHNCGFKRVSPSAYCDCPEKCSCHSLTEGSNSSRLELFKLLLDNSNLADNQNTRGEHIFDLLVAMEARSNHDHVPWHVSRSEGRRTKPDDSSMFVRKALIHVIKQWSLVKPSLAAGLEPGKPVSGHQGSSEGHWLLTVAEQNKILFSQSEVQHLDVLVYALTAKLPRMYLNMLTDTITKSYLANQDETVGLIKRFIRSIARVFLVVWLDNLSLSPRDHLSSSEHCHKISVPAAMERCTAVFESFSSLAIPELARMCNALVSPITLGMYMSCPQSSVNEKPARLAGELFKLPPVSLLRRNLDQSSAVPPEVGMATDDGSDDETAVAISNRERLGGALLPYFRSVLCSSGESSVDELEDSSSDSEHEAAMDVDDRPTVISTHPKDEHWAIHSSKLHHTEFTSNNSAILLSKAFERLLRVVTSLLSFQHGMKGKAQLPGKMPMDPVHENVVWDQLHGIWRWLSAVMDTMECQLRTGEAILSSSLAQQGNSAKKSQQSGRRVGELAVSDGKGLFSQYMLSVLCWQAGEHAYHPPVIDIMNMEHVAWILDGLLHFMMHSGVVSSSSSHFPQLGHDLKQQDDAVTFFFTRSASVSCLGMPPISPFASISQSLPLAEWPQLLTAKASRDLLFHTSTQCLEVWPNCSLPAPPIAALISKPLMTSPNDTAKLTDDDTWGVTSNYLGASVFIGRWCMSCDLLHQAFGNHLRGDRKSVLGMLGGFRVVEKLFHRDMEQFENNGSYKDSTEMLVSREPSKLLAQVLEFFYNQRKAHPHSMTSLLAHVKVVFVDEPGQGTGVTRSLLTAVASCLLTEKRLPSLNHIYEQGGKSIVPAYSQLFGAEQNSNEDPSSPTKWLLGHESNSQEHDDGQGPLLYQPSRSGLYAIHHGTLTMARLEAFHTVGNLIGYSLMMREMFPLPLCRHILKYILQQPVCWEDFAFFDPVMFETFRQLLLDARKETATSIFESMALTFHVALSKEEGGREYDLIPNGALQPVTPDNVLHYISRYAYLRMVHVVEEPLQTIVEGIRDVIPNNCNSFSMLTPEDLRLLLNGTCQVDVELLKSITTFSDESHKNNELIEQFKGWFWSLVERMNNKERQDLLYFWTSSPVTPPTPEGYHPIPTITIRPMDDHHLPTANTCISRLYIPLYSSKSILKSKLLLAIKTKYFGFV